MYVFRQVKKDFTNYSWCSMYSKSFIKLSFMMSCPQSDGLCAIFFPFSISDNDIMHNKFYTATATGSSTSI